ncbi:MAG: glycosyltransferase [Desulfobacterales bacterium]|nr:glycosyltransferase [Desulfobacterales bacterium]
MKIAIIVNSFPSISETFILNHITGLIDKGHTIEIFAYVPPSISLMHSDINKYDLLRYVKYRRILSNRFEKLIKIIIPTFQLLSKCPKKFFRLLKSESSIKNIVNLINDSSSFLNSMEYDIIHAHFGLNGLCARNLIDAGIISGKLVATFHGYDITRYVKQKGVNAYNSLFESDTLLLPVSNHWKQKLIQLGAREENIVVHRMGVDINRFNIKKYFRKNAHINIISIARLVEKKGIAYGIKAINELLKLNSNLLYHIVGDGPLMGSLVNIVKSFGIEKFVKFHGWKSQDEIVEMLSIVDIMIAPSITAKDGDQEGIPLALMEAMACAIPVVSTQHSGISELIDDGVSGFLVKERDFQCIAEKLSLLINDQEKAKKMGREARKKIEYDHDIDKQNSRIISIYKEFIKS